jgi:hypothetical protein
MPSERITKSHADDHIDMVVGWGKGLGGDSLNGPLTPYVRLFPCIAPVVRDEVTYKVRGGVYVQPDREDAHLLGLEPGEGVGPAQMRLNRAQVNRLIRVLRKARDQAFGRDE